MGTQATVTHSHHHDNSNTSKHLLGTSYVPGTILSAFHTLAHLVLIPTLDRSYYLHSIDQVQAHVVAQNYKCHLTFLHISDDGSGLASCLLSSLLL